MPVTVLSGAVSNNSEITVIENAMTAVIEVHDPDSAVVQIIEDSATAVIEVHDQDSMVVQIIEPVSVDLETLGLELDDLVDVDLDGAEPGQVPVLGQDEVWRPGTAPVPAHPPPHVQTTPVLLVQITHGLPYAPAGVTAIDTLGRITEHAGVAHPSLGVTELTYGAPFSGTVYLS